MSKAEPFNAEDFLKEHADFEGQIEAIRESGDQAMAALWLGAHMLVIGAVRAAYLSGRTDMAREATEDYAR